VSIWDARSGLCIQSFYGHTNAVNDVVFSLAGDTIASCDADGHVKVWDVRMVAERATISLGSQAIHAVGFDRSAQVLAAACDDGVVRVLDSGGAGLEMITSLRGHEDSVQDVAFDPTGQYLLSAGGDGAVRIWSEGVIKGAGLQVPGGGDAAGGSGHQQYTHHHHHHGGQAAASPGYPDGDD
jgi:WD40 repeat protein